MAILILMFLICFPMTALAMIVLPLGVVGHYLDKGKKK